jgi:CheY-like chemotaxis protein
VASVLVVDDDRGIRGVVRMALEDAGYHVYEAADGRPALVLLRDHLDGLVVLLDLNMPGMDGVALLRALAADPATATRHVLILCTAGGANASRSLPLDVAKLLAELGIDLLPKPFDVDELLRVVAEAEKQLAHPTSARSESRAQPAKRTSPTGRVRRSRRS